MTQMSARIKDTSTLLQYYIYLRLRVVRLATERLESIEKIGYDEATIKKYLKERRKKTVESAVKFYLYVEEHWQLLVLMDYMHHHELYFGKKSAFVEDGKAVLTKIDTESFKSLKKKVKKHLKKNRSTILKKKGINVLYEILFDKKLFKDLFDQLSKPPPIVVTRDDEMAIVVEPRVEIEKIVRDPTTMRSMFHQNAVGGKYDSIMLRLEWLSVQPDDALKIGPMMAALPYLVEYNKDNTRMFKFLCILSHGSKRHMISQSYMDNTVDDEFDTLLPSFPYQLLLNDMQNIVSFCDYSEHKNLLYVYQYVHDVLAPLLYTNVWKNLTSLVYDIVGIGYQLEKTRIEISWRDQNKLLYLLDTMNGYLRLKGVPTQFETSMRKLMPLLFKIIAVEEEEEEPLFPSLFASDHHDEIREKLNLSIRQTIDGNLDTMRCNSCLLLHADEIETHLIRLLDAFDNRVTSTNSKDDEYYLQKDPGVDIGNDRMLVDCCHRTNKGVHIFETHYTFSLSDLYHRYTSSSSPRERARRNEFLNFFRGTQSNSATFDYARELFHTYNAPRHYAMATSGIMYSDNTMTIGEVKRLLEKQRTEISFDRKLDDTVFPVLNFYVMIYHRHEGDYLDVTHIDTYDEGVMMDESYITLYIHHNIYQYRHLVDVNDDVVLSGEEEEEEETLEVIIEHRNVASNKTLCETTSLVMHTIPYNHHNRVADIYRDREFIITNLLQLDMTLLSQFDISYDETSHQIRLLVTIDTELAVGNEKKDDEQVFRVVTMLDHYRILSRELIILSDNDDMAMVIEENVEEDDDVIRGVIQLFEKYRNMIYYAEDEWASYIGMVIPYVLEGELYESGLVEFRHGLYGGTMHLKVRIESDSQVNVSPVSVEHLIRNLSFYIDDDMERARNVLAIVK